MEHTRSSGLLSMLGLAGCAGGGCATLICVPMALLVWVVKPVMTNLDRVPSYLRPLYDDPRIISTLAAVTALLVLVTSWGIILRRRWGRRLAMAVAVAAACWTVLALPASWSFVSASSRLAMVLMCALNTLVGLLVLAIIAWLLRTLSLPEIRAEFDSPERRTWRGRLSGSG